MKLHYIQNLHAFLVDLIHDARHLCKRLRTDGIIDVMWFVRGANKFKSANTRNRGRVSLFYAAENL